MGGVRDATGGAQGVRPWGGTVTHWSEFEAGGHFPALEEPQLLVDDLKAFLGPLT